MIKLEQSSRSAQLSRSACSQDPARKTFAVAFAKSDVRLEAAAYKAQQNGLLDGLNPEMLLRHRGVQHTPKGILIDEKKAPPDVFNLLKMVQMFGHQPDISIRINNERLSVIKQLSRLGYRVAIPEYGFTARGVLDKARPYARIFKATIPILAKYGKSTEVHGSAAWTRDLWQRFGDIRIRRFTRNGTNAAGEGGMSVVFGERCAMASNDLRNEPIIGVLSANGYSLYFLKDGMQLEPNLSRVLSVDTYMSINHIDLFAGVAGNTLLVDRDYYNNNWSVLKKASKEKGLELVYVPDKEANFYPANFLPLTENRIIMDVRAAETISLLRKNGVEVIPTDMPMEVNMSAGGGIRCFVNVL